MSYVGEVDGGGGVGEGGGVGDAEGGGGVGEGGGVGDADGGGDGTVGTQQLSPS